MNGIFKVCHRVQSLLSSEIPFADGTATYAGRHDADAKQAADKAEECRHRVALTLRFLFVGYRLPGGPCGRFYAIG